MNDRDTHSVLFGYILWIFGFFGAHRFYYGRRLTGILWFFTLGLFFVGWIVDLFLIPGMDREADLHFPPSRYDYNAAWLLLTFGGLLGLHRFYLGKWITGFLYLVSGGIFGLGYIYDFLTLNQQIEELARPVSAHAASVH